ncbi:hypothetical protein AK812_SmicGene14509 [Symbiodinium microadriaticum]|uniref:Uncharacterized protein n=1 Tax=Symbiodinium microadriaticum TaxID=2951 RepID=A0A1Q9E5C1_SYMMI|nr:hypothetical protein AK812_SmicGene14509 [Symbiodinium microadriaticum]
MLCLDAVLTSLADGSVPERLSALLLAQALAVAEAPPAVLEVLASEAERFLDLKDGSHGFAQLGEAALDVLASVSFSHPTAAIENLGWSKMAALLQEGDSPPESGTEQLQVLVCGLLAANCLAAGDGSEAEEVHNRLASGSFFRLYAQCLAASVGREAWPQDSNTYHSPRRLARAASRLATLGFNGPQMTAMFCDRRPALNLHPRGPHRERMALHVVEELGEVDEKSLYARLSRSARSHFSPLGAGFRMRGMRLVVGSAQRSLINDYESARCAHFFAVFLTALAFADFGVGCWYMTCLVCDASSRTPLPLDGRRRDLRWAIGASSSSSSQRSIGDVGGIEVV